MEKFSIGFQEKTIEISGELLSGLNKDTTGTTVSGKYYTIKNIIGDISNIPDSGMIRITGGWFKNKLCHMKKNSKRNRIEFTDLWEDVLSKK